MRAVLSFRKYSFLHQINGCTSRGGLMYDFLSIGVFRPFCESFPVRFLRFLFPILPPSLHPSLASAHLTPASTAPCSRSIFAACSGRWRCANSLPPLHSLILSIPLPFPLLLRPLAVPQTATSSHALLRRLSLLLRRGARCSPLARAAIAALTRYPRARTSL